ncbi:hypothetical protein ETB97_009984 [Aspergillus alliaceus]|uniref:Uncharacterized protein n=1 Tax=Petromyces alliaceus TaxID=209559 RepID=A0A5N7BVB2_PETAA|nr:hypothetical protein BDV23DRAFT_187911 [Aspergillus alliaceus]KAF5863483.1 hypothetical protein ETB97_009984 [Aspergillus burnettii]
MRQARPCYWYYETHVDLECDVGSGFHQTDSWESWQLLNFYQHLFKAPGFDSGAMAAAKESHERGALERHIDTSVPDMRRIARTCRMKNRGDFRSGMNIEV